MRMLPEEEKSTPASFVGLRKKKKKVDVLAPLVPGNVRHCSSTALVSRAVLLDPAPDRRGRWDGAVGSLRVDADAVDLPVGVLESLRVVGDVVLAGGGKGAARRVAAPYLTGPCVLVLVIIFH